jgi:hypothetical protein
MFAGTATETDKSGADSGAMKCSWNGDSSGASTDDRCLLTPVDTLTTFDAEGMAIDRRKDAANNF